MNRKLVYFLLGFIGLCTILGVYLVGLGIYLDFSAVDSYQELKAFQTMFGGCLILIPVFFLFQDAKINP